MYVRPMLMRSLNRAAFRKAIAFAQFADARGGLGRRVLRFSPMVLLRLAVFPQRNRFPHDLLGAAARAFGKGGEVGFLLGRQADFHVFHP